MKRIILATLGLTLAVNAHAEIKQCYLEVNHRVYITGQCDVTAYSDVVIIRGPKWFADLLPGERPDEYRGTWNGIEGDSHADDELGALTKASSGCYVNTNAKVCWR